MPDEDERSYRNKPVWQRALVIVAGPVANWLLAAFFIFLLAATVGFSWDDTDNTVIGQVVEDSPAARAGLLSGDRITSAAGEPVSNWSELVEVIRKNPEQTIALGIERDDEQLALEATPRRTEAGHGQLGVAPRKKVVEPGFFKSIQVGFVGAWDVTVYQVTALAQIAARKREGRLIGPVELFDVMAKEADKGLDVFLNALAALSVMLFLLNLLPVPALDGSRLLFLAVEGVRRRPLNHKLENTVHAIGFVLLLGLILFVTAKWWLAPPVNPP